MNPNPARRLRLPSMLVAAIAALLALPAAGLGHAALESSLPADGQVVADSPAKVSLSFTEPVENAIGEIRVFDGQAVRVDAGRTRSESASVLATAIPERLANGTYTVSWRIVSADGHPIEGAFVFHVGAPGANPEGIAGQVSSGPSTAVTRAADVGRFLDIALIVLLVGAILTTVLVVGGAFPAVERTLWYTVAGVGFTLSVVCGATLILHGASVAGSGFTDAARGSALAAVLDTRFGQVRLAQLLIAEVLSVIAVWAAMGSGLSWLKRIVAALAVGLAVTPGLSGHAGGSGAVAVVADAAHVLAAAVWVGGLATVLFALWRAGEERGELAGILWPRFSLAALVSVGVLLVAGTVNGLMHVDAVSELWETTYGRLLLAKMAIAAILIGFGAVNRRRIRQVRGSARPSWRVGRVAGAELVLMLGALGVTSVLIEQPPASAVQASAPKAGASAGVGDLTLRVQVDPGRRGANRVRVDVTRDGSPVQVDEVTVTAAPAVGDLGPFRLDTAADGGGRYVTGPVELSASGVWRFEVAVRRGEFDLDSATVTIPVAP